MQLEERFWSKVDKSGDCWVWTAATFKGGYGQFRASKTRVSAHRFSYELVKGPIPDGMGVCHTCDNPPCVNPDHLFAGDQGVNLRDCTDKGRHVGNKRFTDVQIKNIREDTRTQGKIAKSYGVHRVTINRIKLKRSYHSV